MQQMQIRADSTESTHLTLYTRPADFSSGSRVQTQDLATPLTQEEVLLSHLARLSSDDPHIVRRKLNIQGIHSIASRECDVVIIPTVSLISGRGSTTCCNAQFMCSGVTGVGRGPNELMNMRKVSSSPARKELISSSENGAAGSSTVALRFWEGPAGEWSVYYRLNPAGFADMLLTR